MKKIAYVGLVLLLSGCSSMQDLREAAPNNEFTSNKSIDDVSNCIMNSWQMQSQRYGSVFIQQYGTGKTVYTQSQLEMVDVTRPSNVTNIKFYHQGGLLGYRVNSRLESIKQCL